MSLVLELTDETFFPTLKSEELPILVDFWAQWCAPCRAMTPIVERVAEQFQGRLVVASVNTEFNPGVAQSLGIKGIPLFILFKGNQSIAQILGSRSEHDFINWVQTTLQQ